MSQQQQQQPQPHPHQRSVIDLTSADEEAKRRIVAHAQRQLAQQQASERPQPIRIELSDDDDDEDLPDQGRGEEQHAKKQRAERASADEHTAQEEEQQRPAATPSFSNHPVLYPMRDVLKAAHQERMRRQLQQPPADEAPQRAADVEMAAPPPRSNASGGAGAGAAPSKGPPAAAAGTKRPRLFGTELPHGGGGGGGGAGASGASASLALPPAQPLPGRSQGPVTITVLTFNIWSVASHVHSWFAEHVALEERMRGLADLVLRLQPDVLMFQEVTHNMVRLWFEQHSWLADVYSFSQPPNDGSQYYTMLALRKQTMRPLASSAAQVALQGNPNAHPRLITRWPFPNSQMGRDVVSVALQPLQHPRAPPLLVATSHLESPLGAQAGKHMAQEREQQVALALPHLQQLAAAAAALAQPHRLGGQQQQQQRQQQQPMDILWGGDFNWNQANAAELPLPDAWEDVWQSCPEARAPGEPHGGHTYDRRRNATIAGSKFPPARLDRFVARLGSWQVDSMRLEGTKPIEGVTAPYYGKQVQVHISDHFGILLRLRWDGD